MAARLLLAGLSIWAVSTLAIRLAGHYILQPGRTLAMLLLYAFSFAAMALLVPWLSRRLGARDEVRAAALLMLPTLALDAFSCLFFDRVFPNLHPALAAVFGGWMLICCAGAVVGTRPFRG